MMVSDVDTSLNKDFPFVQQYHGVGFSVPCDLNSLQSPVLSCHIVTQAVLYFYAVWSFMLSFL